MQNTHLNTRSIGRAVLVALLVAPMMTLDAQFRIEDRDRDRRESSDARRRDEERRLFTWRGTVDDDTRIYIRANRVESRVVDGSSVRRNPRVERVRSLPRRDGYLRVELLEGRGRVHVIQQPSARNDYTAIVRVKDGYGGADNYRFAAYFDPVDASRRDRRGDVWRGDRDGDWDDRYGERLINWRGNVDGDVRIVLRESGISYSVASGAQPRGISMTGATRLPRGDGRLSVNLRQGRGNVTVVQQPSRFNNYTAIVRVLDPQGSYGYYDFDLYWQ